MTTIIYADILFIINFCVDYICFYFVYKIFNFKIKFYRIIIASIIGAIYGLFAVFYSNMLIHFVVLGIMGIIGFGFRTNGVVKLIFVYFLFAATLGGITIALYNFLENTVIIYIYIIIAANFSYFYYKSLKNNIDDRILDVIIVDNGVTYNESGFVDTGNLLVDPYNGNNVILVKKRMFSNDFKIEERNNFRYIPTNYRGEYVIKAFIPDTVIIKYKDKMLELKATVAIDESNGDYNGNLILIPKRLIGEFI